MTEEKRDPLVQRLESIAASVESRDRATLAKLRRSLSEEVPFEALRVVMPYVRGADEHVARREDDAALLAGLFALHPASHSRSLASALRSAAEKSDSVELRFRAMFSASREDLAQGVTDKELDGFAKQARGWAKRGDVFLYFISGAKVRNPAAAQALIKKLGK